LSAGVERRVDLEPWVSRRVVSIPKPTLAEPSADLVRLEAVWAKQWPEPLKPTLRALQQLPLAVRAAEGLVTLLCADDEVVRIEPGQGPPRLLGLALDIGTTTVVGYLLDLETGRQLAVSSLLNPQTRYGDDVVSRIEFSQHEGGLATLQREIVAAINHIIEETVALATAAGEGGISADAILAMTVVGNTTMQHLFLGISPAALAQSPYVPAMTAAQCLRAHELGINIYPDAHVWTLPNIAGWVGADTVGVLLATGIYQDQEIGLAIDIGTNGEMALGSQERLITCSTAAGPAFEGAHLSCGMRAADGAIDAVHMNEDVHWHSIGGAPPRGICGSGLVDLVAEMLRVGVINTAGFMGDGEALRNNGQAKLADRLRQIGRQRA
ncbi:MAG: DUF4445 domain-containing protein, partial [Clostridia bacterium]|nr:DUF4445 domain-containing protein [Clostridia bacterium]